MTKQGAPAAAYTASELLAVMASRLLNDGQIVFATGTKGIQRVSENGGKPETIVPAGGALMQGPQMLPGGDTIIFSATTDGAG